MRIELFGPTITAVALAVLLLAQPAAAGTECDEHFDSTFEMVQKIVIERHGCTNLNCHSGAVPAGGLDLSPEVAYENLLHANVQSIPSTLIPGLRRVEPNNKGRSLLWLNLAAATLPNLWKAPLRPMPQGGVAPLTFDELDLVRLWIENGATRDGVVPGSAELFNACLPPPRPLEVEPLEPPSPDVGVQMRAPRQVLPANTEREVCFVSYYDITDQVPERFRGPSGNTVRYKRVNARQDPLSHHAVIIRYEGRTPIESPVWGPFACRGGANDGQPCAPKEQGACGEDSICASAPTRSLACIGFGPGDASIGNGEKTLFSTMASAAQGREGIYEEIPLTGILVWNSHAFNVTNEPAKLDMWVNFEFAAPEEQVRPLQHFVDVSAISKMHVEPFALEEVCHSFVVPGGTRLLEIASHTHKRGKRFRVFHGDFKCESGLHEGESCSPFGPDPGLPIADLCAGAPCVSRIPPEVGDCNGDLEVTIDELVLGVAIALDREPASVCPPFDHDTNGAVTINELVGAVQAALNAGERDAEQSLVYTNLTYADPLIQQFDPAMHLASDSSKGDRTLTFCALYDNGYTNPDEVKRSSRIPTNGAPCRPTHCAEGRIGTPCVMHAQCDSQPREGDGSCDACDVGFGVSTDDEMFVLIGSYVFD